MASESDSLGDLAYVSAATQCQGPRRATGGLAGRVTSTVSRGIERCRAGAADAAGPRTTTSGWSRPSARGDDRAFEAALRALPAPHPRLRPRHGQGPRPRGGRDAGGLRLRPAADARDRAADRVQALALPDRQERCIDAFRRSRRAEEVSYDADDAPRAADHLAARRRRPVARRGGRGQAGARQPVRRLRRPVARPTTRSSSCASSRAAPTRRSASAWA